MASTHPHHGARSNATEACGAYCDDISSLVLGTGTLLNAYIPGMTGMPGNGGQMINMRYGSNSDPNEDFALEDLGTVSTQCRSNTNPDGPLASNSVACNNYGGDEAFEAVFSPYGNDSGFCAGTKGTPSANVKLTVRLYSCGVTEGTILIQDTNNTYTNTNGTYYPYISGATSTFSFPDVLTVDPGTFRPANGIFVEQERLQGGGGSGPTAKDTQLFLDTPGPATP